MTKIHTDPRIPDLDQSMLVPVLERHAGERPDELFALFEDGSQWTFKETLQQVRRTAQALHALGVCQGDHVGVWLPSGPDAVRLWFAINYLGAVFVPLNLAYRGKLLEHCLGNAGIGLLITHTELAPRLADITLGQLTDLVVLGGAAPSLPDVTLHPASALHSEQDHYPPAADLAPWDTQMIIYTSGTTGPSKAVLVSYMQMFVGSQASFAYTSSQDRFLANLPLFHITGVAMVIRMLLVGGSFSMVSAFSTQQYWDLVARTKATSVLLMGVMATFLMKQPITANEREHALRTAMIVPLSEDAEAFSQRFGCDVYTAFAMSEISTPLTAGPNPQPIGTCGKPRAGVEVRLVDQHDCEVTAGQTGELIIRSDQPWAMSHGYLNNPEATAAAWRNGWFHTGDGFRQDDEGNFFFVDRIKDAIRRRGENISSFEVEAEVCSHPSVREAAVVAVASEFGEDDVMAVISLLPGISLEPGELIEYLVPRMPYFMVPRYIRIIDELPKTPTQKVQKHLLRAEGLVTGVFDREQAGLSLKRETLSQL